MSCIDVSTPTVGHESRALQRLFRAPNVAAKFLCPPDPQKNSKSRIAAAGGRTIASRDRSKVAQRECASDEPTKSQSSPVAPSYGQNSHFGPERGREFSLSPPDPLKPVNREMRPQEAEPSEVAVVQKLRNGLPVPRSQKFPKNSPVAASYGQKMLYGGGGASHLPPRPKSN